jgi:hypothetical protein
VTECEHANKTFRTTHENWFDGDEVDIYDCNDCGATVRVYIPR